MKRECIFDKGTPLTREHAIPQWIHEYLPGGGELRVARGSGEEWKAKALNLTVARVCESCNHGWMSRLEGRSKPLLIDPIRQRERIWTPKEQRTVATWAYKTALMCSLASGHTRAPDAHYRHLRKKLHPPGTVQIWAAAHAATPGAEEFQVAVIQSRGMLLEGRRSGLKANGYAVTIGIGHLAFQIFGTDSRQHFQLNAPSIYGATADQYEVRIWPAQARSVKWPPSRGFDTGALLAYSQRFESVS